MSMKKTINGFTIVELGVVIAVIGILASITYVSYGAWQRRIATEALKTDFASAAVQLKSDLNWTSAYPATQGAANGGAGLPKSDSTTYQYTYTAATNSYCLTATSTRTGVPAMMISSDNTTPREGVCEGHEGPTIPGVGDTWTARSGRGQDVAYGAGQYVAVAANTNGQIRTSSDGVTWTTRTVPQGEWRSIAYGNGIFVAVTNQGGTTSPNCVMTSPDAINWTAQPITCGNAMTVGYGNGLFAMTGTNGNGYNVRTSPDGVTWTTRTVPSSDWADITYANGMFVAVGDMTLGGRAANIITSTDGVTWTARTAPENNSWESVTYGSGKFVAVASTGTNRIMTSPDGITWTARTAPEANDWASVAYGNGKFIAVSTYYGTNRMMTSTDGITWASQSIPAQQWRSIIFAGGRFVVVGESSILTSP